MVDVLIYIISEKCGWKKIKMNMDAAINVYGIFLFTRCFVSVFTISYISRLKDT